MKNEQHELKGIKRFRNSAIICAIISVAAGVFFASTPLLNTIGYESGAAAALLFSITAFIVGASGGAYAKQTTSHESGSSNHPISFLITSIMYSFLIIFLNFIIVCGYSYFINTCNMGNGLYLYFMMAVPTMILFCCAGFLAGIRFKWPVRILLWFLIFGGTGVLTLLEFLNGQRQVVHNLTIGLFSMSGFNGFSLTIPNSFPAYRILTCVAGLFFAGLAISSTSNKKTGIATAALSLFVILSCAIFAGDATGLASGHSTMIKELSATHEAENSILHFSPGTFSDDEATVASKFTEFYLMEIREALEMDQPWKVDVYIYNDSDQMERHTGARDFYFAQPWKQSLHIEKRSVNSRILKHELVHVMMGAYGRGIFGTPYNIGLIEGVATAIERNYFLGEGFQSNFAAAIQAEVISSGGKSVNNAGFGASSMTKSYDMAGGFIGFLMNKYGMEKSKSFYANPDPQKVYEKSFNLLNTEWTDWLKTQTSTDYEIKRAAFLYDDVSYPAFYKTKCPRTGMRTPQNSPYDKYTTYSEKKEFESAAAVCDEVFDKTGNPIWLLKEANSFDKIEKFPEAIAALQKIFTLENVAPVVLDEAYQKLIIAFAKSDNKEEAENTLLARKKYGFDEPGLLEFESQLTNTKGFMKLIPYLLERKCPDKKLFSEVIGAEKHMPEIRAAIVYLSLFNNPVSETDIDDLDRDAKFFAANAYGLEKFKFDLLNSLAFKYIDINEPAKARELFEIAKTSASNDKEMFYANRNIRIANFFMSEN